MDEKDSIEINVSGAKEVFGKVTNFLKNKNIQLIIVLVLFAIILVSSTSLRLSNLSNLKDKTTGNYVFADPDAFYEYRVAQTIVNHGDVNSIDPMRNQGLNLTYTKELLPVVLAYAYKIINPINHSITLDYIDVIYPVVAFALSLIIFFVLCWYLSKSKGIALLASLMLAYSPAFFQRTGAGISSHEALGVIFMFLSFLIYAISVNNYKKSWRSSIFLGIITGISLALSLFSWSGGSNFALMIFPLSSLIYYFFGIEDKDKELKKKFIGFNLFWIISSVVIMPLLGYSFSAMISRFFSNYGLIVPFSFILITLDFILENYSEKMKSEQGKYRILYSLLGTIILGFIGLIIIGKNPFAVLIDGYNQLLYPFGQGRVGLTVAYYAQPYLIDLINQTSVPIFWMFFLGLVFLGIEFGKGIISKKHKIYFYIAWIFAISGMMFSRISSSSIFNGTNFISRLFYISSFIIFAIYLVWLYLKEKFLVDSRIIFLSAWMVVMLMSARSAIRVLFVVITFVFVGVAIFVIKSYEYGNKIKDKTIKYLLLGSSFVFLLIVLNLVFGNPLAGVAGNYQVVSNSAKYSGPVTGEQWQNAMSWVRNNTDKSSVFVSWWDYGYLIQTLGNRITIVDGGNANQYWDHLVGRYVLTEPNPDASLSFMKTHNVSYLLVDPTDIGKYSAFSRIGSDALGNDRASFLPTMILNPSQTQEANNSQTFVYQGGTNLDQDIIYNQPGGGVILLPKETAFLAGVILQVVNKGNFTLNQPGAVFINNQKQITIPLRYLYFNNQIMDFGSGLGAGIDVIPSISYSGQNVQTNNFGALIYLSPKVFNSLFAQLYLMNDPFKKYPTVKIADLEQDPFVNSMRSQGVSIGDIIFANGFGGIRAPLKIWKVDYPNNILVRPEFLSPSGGYAAFDNLTFTG